MARVVVVGTGIAGLIAAYRASADHDVVLVTKADLGESNTKYAQGGIAAAMFPDDSAEAHAADTVRAGDGLCDPATVDVLCSEGPGRVRDLIALGVEFDRINGVLERGHEAAHSARRVIHAGGDATGLAIETALVSAVRTLALEVHEHTFMRDLVIDDSGAERRVSGIEVVDASGVVRVIDADIVILASGGAGQLYTHTTNPLVATGDGTAAALRAGVVLADLEFYQFHPTALAVAGTPLVSEAVRGEGAVLLDENGRRFMFDVHPDGELAPRDVVARGIANAMAAQGGRPVLLDATALGRDYLAQRFPGIDKSCAAHGFDWATTPIPVTPGGALLDGRNPHGRARPHLAARAVRGRRGRVHGRSRREQARIQLAARVSRLRLARHGCAHRGVAAVRHVRDHAGRRCRRRRSGDPRRGAATDVGSRRDRAIRGGAPRRRGPARAVDRRRRYRRRPRDPQPARPRPADGDRRAVARGVEGRPLAHRLPRDFGTIRAILRLRRAVDRASKGRGSCCELRCR